jgi:hypothetical protein
MVFNTGLFTIAMVMGAALSNVQPAAAGAASGICSRSGESVTCTAQWGSAGGGFPQIIYVPDQDRWDADTADQREKRWLARCRPVIRQDQYGVARYAYAAPGCEFGKSEH